MEKISILGCGWLGRPLAVQLLSEGYQVNGSTTSEEKLAPLKQDGINAWLIKTEPLGVLGNWSDFVQNADWLVVNIPPGMKKNGAASFLASMHQLCKKIEQSNVKKIVLVSSTSVFADTPQPFTEDDVPIPDSENGQALYQVEQLFQKIPSATTTVIRFGGLIGADRHPVKYLAGKTGIPSPLAAVNLIHLEDCIGIILMVIKQNICGEILHAVSPYHPSRVEYYTQKAIEMGLPLPIFEPNNIHLGKTINSNLLREKFGYLFIKPEL